MEIDRRNFLKTTGKAVTVGEATLSLGGRILGAKDRARVAICRVRGRGNDHIKGFAKGPNTEIAALCDVDDNVLKQRINDVVKMGRAKLKAYTDVRELKDKDTDEISIATPNLARG
jgi:predicted dehydrogenase